MSKENGVSFTRYQYSRWNRQPHAKEFVRETEHCLFDARGRKTMKRNSYESWHETAEEVQAMIDARNESEKQQEALELKRMAAPALYEVLIAVEFGIKSELALQGNKAWAGLLADVQAVLAQARGEQPCQN